MFVRTHSVIPTFCAGEQKPTIDFVSKQTQTVFVLAPHAQIEDFESKMKRWKLFGVSNFVASDFNSKHILNEMRRLVGDREVKVVFVDVNKELCKDNRCDVVDEYGYSKLADGSHFSSIFAEKVVESLGPNILVSFNDMDRIYSE